MATTKVSTTAIDAVPAERVQLQSLLLENPNYFGTLLKTDPLYAKFKPVKVINGNTTYEELTCVGYNPEIQTLTGIVKINLDSGFNGGSCTPGSKEYIRFYADYHDGAGWQDLGAVSFSSHDIPHTGKSPLSYAANLHFVPKIQHCCDAAPILPTVRAILSWNFLPPAGNPGFIPVWGNILEVNIQVAASTSIACLLKKGLTGLGVNVKAEQATALSKAIPAAAVDLSHPSVAETFNTQESLADLVKAYGNAVEPERVGFTTVANALSAGTANTQALHAELTAASLDISKIMAFINNPKFNTTYEEVKCVGLNESTSSLEATINMKKSSGFSGGLCTKGSREFVAFYMDFQDGAGWRYMGTSSVGVHDIATLPGGGLCYHVELPVNLVPYQKQTCKDVYLAKVRAILSWNQLPPVNNPAWVAPWGNWLESWVEIPYSAIAGGNNKPVLLTIGTLPAAKVNTTTGLVDKTLGAPDATVDAYDGYSFNGSIPITGVVPVPPDSNDNPAAQLQYRIMLKKASQPDSAFAPVTNTFNVLKTVISGGMPVQTTVPQVNHAGYYNYLVDYTAPTIVTVYGDLLGELILPDSDVYEFYIETLGGLTTSRYRVKSDKNAPKNVHLVVDGGQICGSLKQGTPITGTYSLADDENNCLGVYFDLLWWPPGTSSALTVDGAAQSFATVIPEPGAGRNGTWSITTNKLNPCGYNFRMYAYDKTILCYHTLSYAYSITSQYSYDTIGFCLAQP